MNEYTQGGNSPAFRRHPDGTVEILQGATDLSGLVLSQIPAPVTALRVPGTVKVIPAAFARDLPDLASVELQEGVEAIGDRAFSCCGSLRDIRLPRSLRRIGEKAFFGTALRSLTLPDHLEELGVGAFQRCSFLRDLNLPAGLREIPFQAFQETALTEVTIPEGTEEIGIGAFSECWYLRTVRLPSSLRTIWHYAFSTTDLTEVDVPEGVKEIQGSAFEGCKRLEHIRLPQSLRVIGDRAFFSTALSSLEIPDGVEEILYCVFFGCPLLTAITLPAGLMILEEQQFSSDTLTLTFAAIPMCVKHLDLPDATRIVLSPGVGADRAALDRLLRSLASERIPELVADHIPLQSLPPRCRVWKYRGWETRMRQGEPVPEETQRDLQAGLRSNRVRLWRAGVLRQKLLDEGLLTLGDVQNFLTAATKEQDVELTAQLLEYQKNHFPPEEIARRERIRASRALADLRLPTEPEAHPPKGQP